MMNLDDYIKLRFYLNNANYTEVITSHIPDTTIIEKHVYTEDKQNIKYTLKYYMKEYAYEPNDGADSPHRFAVNLSVSLYVKNNSLINNKKKYIPNDSININYYMGVFSEPCEIEKHIETIWNSLNIFDNYPFKGYY